MQPSMFNVRVPLDAAGRQDDVFLMNTFTDAQLIVSRDVAALLDRVGSADPEALNATERTALTTLSEHGFIVDNREAERRHIEQWFRDLRHSPDQLRVTVLTPLQCNFACDYCFQGDHGDYNKFADKMSPDTSEQVARWIDSRMDELHPKRLTLTFFGGEPLVNLPALYDLAER